jgi:DNA-nicking Smr family endonuclease
MKTPDHNLWDEVTQGVKPLKRSGRKPIPVADVKPSISKPVHHPPPVRSKTPPPITGFDRRTEQKLTRGNADIDARIDLHGVGLEMARVRLHDFLVNRRMQGDRLVLVITGKGDSPFSRHTLHGAATFHSPERQGRLRRHVPEWLHEASFRNLVSGFQPAHPKHGGGGAFYVKLRRIREP